MKKIGSLLLALTLAAALTVPARADVIWEPGDRGENAAFFYEHEDECAGVLTGACETKTETPLYSDPEEQRVLKTLPAGAELYVHWIWRDAAGEKWGLTLSEEGFWGGVWFRLENVRKLYQYDDFFFDHSEEYRVEFGAIPVTAERAVYVYSFPGAGAPYAVGGASEGPTYDDPGFRYDRTYVDGNGLTWGLQRQYGDLYHANTWVCVTDPYTEQPRTAPRYSDRAWPEPPGAASAPAEPTPPVEPTPAEEQSGADAPAAPAAEQGAPIGLIVGLVAAAVAVSAALLVILRKKK